MDKKCSFICSQENVMKSFWTILNISLYTIADMNFSLLIYLSFLRVNNNNFETIKKIYLI